MQKEPLEVTVSTDVWLLKKCQWERGNKHVKQKVFPFPLGLEIKSWSSCSSVWDVTSLCFRCSVIIISNVFILIVIDERHLLDSTKENVCIFFSPPFFLYSLDLGAKWNINRSIQPGKNNKPRHIYSPLCLGSNLRTTYIAFFFNMPFFRLNLNSSTGCWYLLHANMDCIDLSIRYPSVYFWQCVNSRE